MSSSSRLIGSWRVSYATGMDPDHGPHSYMDGSIHLWINGWMVLQDHLDSVIVGCYRGSEEVINIGTKVIFATHFARILCSDLPPSEVRAPVCVPPDLNWQWKVSYSTFKDLDRGRMKSYDGSLHLLAAENWLILKNVKSAPISVKALSDDQVTNAGKVFCLGAKVNFPQHAVRVGKCLSVPNVLKPLASSSVDDLHQDSKSAAIPSESDLVSEEHVQADDRENSTTHPEQQFSSTVFDSLSMGLDFSPGKSFAKLIRQRFFLSVHSSIDMAHFTLVVSFGRANFCLSEESVGIALEAAIGGYCGHLKVSLLRERVYSFVVSSKQVGFEIIKKRFYSCQQFKCYFNLWGLGGPNWAREFRLWQNECNEEWTLVSPSKKRLAQGVNALKLAKPKSAIKKSYAVKKKLTFASTLDYVARKGYTNDSPIQKSTDIVTVPSKASNERTLRDVVVSNVIPSDTIPSVSEHLNKGKAPVDLVENSDNDGLDEVVNDIAF
jgi:hypothetical protein